MRYEEIMSRITKKQQAEIIFAFKEELIPIIRLADRYKVSRQAIYKMLSKNGVEMKAFSIVMVKCDTCGAEIKRNRCRVRKQKHHFCNIACHAAFLEARIGKQKMARFKVSEHFKLKPENVIHFDDGNDWNTSIHNLAVFANQQDHILWHFNKSAEPIWKFSL